MQELQVTIRFAIQDGKQEEFKRLAGEWLNISSEEASGPSASDWYYNYKQTACLVFERYADSPTLLEHVASIGEIMGAMLEIADMSAEICGPASSELIEAAKGHDVAFYHHDQGL